MKKTILKEKYRRRRTTKDSEKGKEKKVENKKVKFKKIIN